MQNVLQTARVIWMGMFVGMLIFLGLLYFVVVPSMMTPTAAPGTTTAPAAPTGAFSAELAFMIWIGVAVSGAIAFGVVQKVLIQNIRNEWQQRSDDSAAINLSPKWFMVWMCGSAIVEGVGLLATIFYLLTADPMLAGAALTAILIMGTRYPSESSLRSFSDSITLSTSGPMDLHPR